MLNINGTLRESNVDPCLTGRKRARESRNCTSDYINNHRRNKILLWSYESRSNSLVHDQCPSKNWVEHCSVSLYQGSWWELYGQIL